MRPVSLLGVQILSRHFTMFHPKLEIRPAFPTPRDHIMRKTIIDYIVNSHEIGNLFLMFVLQNKLIFDNF